MLPDLYTRNAALKINTEVGWRVVAAHVSFIEAT